MKNMEIQNELPIKSLPPREEMEKAFIAKNSGYDGLFYVAVKTTGIFCKPSCPSKPKLENVEFYPTIREAIFAGYRPCKKCHPLELAGELPDWVSELIKMIEENPKKKITAIHLINLGISPERARRWFLSHYGMTFAEWTRGRRLAESFTKLRQGSSIDDAAFDNGFESNSGFRDAFSKKFGIPPGKISKSDFIAAQIIETPIGQMIAAAVQSGLCLLEFNDRRMLETNYAIIQKRFGYGIVPATNEHIEQIKSELKDYFAGKLKRFNVRLETHGTEFQEQVWVGLKKINYGETISYEELAQRIGNPKAVRAVANANGSNRLGIIIPCHRVIGKDGTLTGYGGGLWRKKYLLDLERNNL